MINKQEKFEKEVINIFTKEKLGEGNYKLCNRCKTIKSLSDYHKDKHQKDGCSNICKKCINKERRQEYKENKNKFINKKLKVNYGINLYEYKLMLKRQKKVCKICGCKETVRGRGGGIRALSVDHSHKTSEIRGLLCDSCNKLIGHAYENPFILIKAIKYLKGD